MKYSTYSSRGAEAAVELNSDQSLGNDSDRLKCLLAKGTASLGANGDEGVRELCPWMIADHCS